MSSFEKHFGEEDPNTATSCSNLAVVLQDLGDYPRALELSRIALAIFKSTLPKGHPDIVTANINYQSIINDIESKNTQQFQKQLTSAFYLLFSCSQDQDEVVIGINTSDWVKLVACDNLSAAMLRSLLKFICSFIIILHVTPVNGLFVGGIIIQEEGKMRYGLLLPTGR